MAASGKFVKALLHPCDALAHLFVRRRLEIPQPHARRSARYKYAVPVECRATAELSELQRIPPVWISRTVDHRAKRSRHDDSVINELPQRYVAVDNRVPWRVEGRHPLHRKRRFASPGAKVIRAFRRRAAESPADLAHDVVLPHGTLSVVESMASVWARKKRPRRRDVDVKQPLETKRLHFCALLRAEPLVCALGAHRIEASSAPRRLAALERPVGILFHDIFRIPRIGDHVAVAERGMADDLIAACLCMADAFLQLLLSAKRRFDRKNLGIRAVVSATVPPDETELRAANALSPAFVDDFLYAVKCDDGLHRRLIARHLFHYRARRGFPGLAYPHLDVRNGVRKLRIPLRLLGKRNSRSAFKLILPVASCDSGIVRVVSRQKMVVDSDVFVELNVLFGKKNRTLCIHAVLRADLDGERMRHSCHDGAIRHTRRLHPEHRHKDMPVLVCAAVVDAIRAERVVRHDPIAVLALLCRCEIRRDRQALCLH